jgi:hypothetical protein
MALAQYPPSLDQQLPIQSKHPYLLSVAPKQALPMSNPYFQNKSTSGLEPWDAPQTSSTIDLSYSTLQSPVQLSEPSLSQAIASRAHPLQHPFQTCRNATLHWHPAFPYRSSAIYPLTHLVYEVSIPCSDSPPPAETCCTPWMMDSTWSRPL